MDPSSARLVPLLDRLSSLPAPSLRREAKRGGAEAQFVLGMLHATGSAADVPHDAALAAKWLRRAAEGGLSAAMQSMALLLEAGVIEDDAEADEWFDRAAAAGQTESLYRVAERLLLEGRPDEARETALPAAEAGHADAAVLVGSLELERDPEAAVRWLRAAADDDAHPVADLLLGVVLRRGGEENDGEARERLTRAAESGLRKAQQELAGMLESSDPEEARRWRREAERNDDEGRVAYPPGWEELFGG